MVPSLQRPPLRRRNQGMHQTLAKDLSQPYDEDFKEEKSSVDGRKENRKLESKLPSKRQDLGIRTSNIKAGSGCKDWDAAEPLTTTVRPISEWKAQAEDNWNGYTLQGEVTTGNSKSLYKKDAEDKELGKDNPYVLLFR